MKIKQKNIVNWITWKLWGYSISDDTVLKMLKRRFWLYISMIFRIGLCQNCGKITKDKNYFCDSEGDLPYLDYCCRECHENRN